MVEPVKYLFFITTATAASVWVVNRFWGSFFERKKISPLSVLPWLLYCAYQICALHNRLVFFPWHSMLSFLVNTLLMFLIVVWGFEAAGREKYFLFMLFCAVWALIELSLELFLQFFDLGNYAKMLIGTASSAILMMAFSHIVYLLWDKKYKELVPSRLCLLLFLIPVGSIYIMILQYRHTKSNYLLSSSILSILLLFNLIVFDVYIRINRFFLREKENAVYAEQLSLISRNMEEQQKLMEEFYEEKHNLVNELTALRGEMNQDSSGEAARNLDRILGNCHGMGSVSSSGNAVIDAVINAKYATARQYGIAFRLHICVPEEPIVEPCDLGIVIGNALDNAITAVCGCRSSEKIIRISIGVRKNAWIMVMKNPYEHVIKRNRNGELLSDKPDRRRHGYGLQSIRRIADAYAGDVIIDTDQGWFSLTVVLNFR